MGHLGWMAAMLLSPSAVSAGDIASATADSRATIDAPISIVANQDIILGSILLRGASANAADPAIRRSGVGFILSNDSTRASFIVAGRADQAVSVTIPIRIALTSTAGTEGLTVETLTGLPSRAGSQLSQSTLNDHGLLLLSIRSRVVLGTNPVSGIYMGLLIATAQYN